MIGRGRAVVAALAVLLLSVGAALGVTFTNAELAGTWNVLSVYATAVGEGTITFAAGSPFGARTAGADTLVFDAGGIITGGLSSDPNVNAAMGSYVVFPPGLLAADRSATELATDLPNFNPTEIVRGSLSDTDASAVFFAVRMLSGGTDDLFVGLKSNGLDTPAMLGAVGGDTFMGASLSRSISDSIAMQSIFAASRILDTALTARVLLAGASVALPHSAGPIDDTTGVGGVMRFRPNRPTSIQVGGPPAGAFFADTGSIYRIAGTADTNLAVIIQDTNPLQPVADHRQMIAFAVRRRTPLVLRDLFGPWQVGIVRPESGAFDGKFAFFEFRGDGTGTFDNGAPGSFHHVTPCTFTVKSDDLGGATRGDSYYEIAFTPVPGLGSVAFRAYLSQNGRFLSGASGDNVRRFIMVGAKRANTVNAAIAPGGQDTPVSTSNLSVGMEVGTGATTGTATFAFSPIDSSSVRVADFLNQRDATLQTRGISSVFSALDIVPDTTIANPESITITLNFCGSSEDTGGGGANGTLTPLVYDDTNAVWTPIADTLVVQRCCCIVVFHPPHFSTYGVGLASDTDPLTFAAGGGTCLLGRSGLPTSWLGTLRAWRDLLLGAAPGRFLSRLYYLLF